MAAKNALDTTIAVVTPENIAFDYQLAGPFRRLPAFLIDLAVRWALILGVVAALSLIGGLLNIFTSVFGSYMTAILVISHFAISWFYGTVMEAYFNGRTVGKWACGIRVIDIDGRPVTGKSALIRNLLRIADLAPFAPVNFFIVDAPGFLLLPTGMIALLTMVATRRLQRLGDLAAGTMVIVDERSWRLPVARVEDPRVAALASYVPGDYRVSRSMARTLAIYAERRHYLTPGRRSEIARHLAKPLLERFEFRDDIDHDLLLYALYYKTYLSDGEEPDLGPLQGFSPLLRDAHKAVGLEGERQTVSPLTGQLPSSSTVRPLVTSQAVPASPATPPPSPPQPPPPPPSSSSPGSR